MKKFVILILVMLLATIFYSCSKKRTIAGVIASEMYVCANSPKSFSVSVDTNTDGKIDLYCVNFARDICYPSDIEKGQEEFVSFSDKMSLVDKKCTIQVKNGDYLIIKMY